MSSKNANAFVENRFFFETEAVAVENVYRAFSFWDIAVHVAHVNAPQETRRVGREGKPDNPVTHEHAGLELAETHFAVQSEERALNAEFNYRYHLAPLRTHSCNFTADHPPVHELPAQDAASRHDVAFPEVAFHETTDHPSHPVEPLPETVSPPLAKLARVLNALRRKLVHQIPLVRLLETLIVPKIPFANMAVH
jgi:hypothetical protein